jgi:hypothetical protein
MVFKRSVWCVLIAALGLTVGVTSVGWGVCYWGCDEVSEYRMDTTEAYNYHWFYEAGYDGGVHLNLYFPAYGSGNDLVREDSGPFTPRRLCRFCSYECGSQLPAIANEASCQRVNCVDDGKIRIGNCIDPDS